MDLWEILSPKAFLISALVFVPLERLFALRKDQKILRRHWQNDAIYAFANRIFIFVGMLVMFAVFLGVTRRTMPEGVREAVASQPLWLQVIEVVILADLGFYLAHRAFHAFPVLWRFHKIHHSIEELDWLAAYRVHPVDQILTNTASMVPIFALDFSGSAIAVYALIYQWQSLLIHANVDIPFGPLKWLVASPQFHHWHHGNHREAYDRNFAGQLSVLDWLFGTLHMPGAEMPRKYGIDDEVPPYYHQQLIHPFVKRRRQAEPDAASEAVAEPSEAEAR